MAFNRFAIICIAMIFLPTIAIATEYIVGDSKGWTNTNVDYVAWAKDKMFNVGDTLVFQYDPAKHNVFSVNGTSFGDCVAPLGSKNFTTGNDTIVLKTAGPKWYICTKPNHCGAGQKLTISVMDMIAPAPSAAAGPTVFAAFRVVMIVAATVFPLLLSLH